MSQPARVRRPLLLVWWALFVAAVAVMPVSEASAAPLTTGGFTTSVGAAPARVTRGATVSIDVTVTADTGRQALVDLEVYGPSGAKVFQHWWDGQSFAAGAGTHVVRHVDRAERRAASACTRSRSACSARAGARCSTGTTTPPRSG